MLRFLTVTAGLLLMPVLALADEIPGPEPVTGAQVDESVIAREIVVSPAIAGSRSTLSAGFTEAWEHLKSGTPVRIRIMAGTYREAAPSLDWTAGKAADTLLVVQGEGTVIWTGADLYPPSVWREESAGLHSTAWAHRLGHFSPAWGPPLYAGHRSEQAFINGRPLRPVILEPFAVEGMGHWSGKPVTYSPLPRLDPQRSLAAGQFGVIEPGEVEGRLFVRLEGEMPPQGIEVAVRSNLVDFTGKRGLVLRGITFTQTASSLRSYETDGAVVFGWRANQLSSDVLIEDCQFLWNSGSGLRLSGTRWTLRRSSFNYNGFSGITSGESSDILFEDTEASFNGWRAHLGGELAWFTGGVKLHSITRNRVERHTGIGNLVAGFWYDIHCRDVVMRDCVLVENLYGLMWELSQGPFVGERLLVAGGKMGEGSGMRFWNLGSASVRDSIFYGNYGSGSPPPTIVDHFANRRIEAPTDEHARKARIEPSQWRMENCLVVGGGRQLHLAGIRDRRTTEASTLAPIPASGRSNYFHVPGRPNGKDAFLVQKAGSDSFESTDFANWSKLADQQDSVWSDIPLLEDPDGHDYRPRGGILPPSLEASLPGYQLPAGQAEEMQAFFNWIGYHPRKW